jgi:hypothetical protein
MKQKREAEPREGSTKTRHHTPILELPPPPDWSVFRRSGRIQEAERLAVLAIQEEHPVLQEHANGFLVEAYRSYKRKQANRIATCQD